MSLPKGRHAAATDSPPRNARREHLSDLYAALQTHPELGAGLVERRGVTWLSVVRYGTPHHPAEIGCDYRNGTWWFCWSTDARPIAPAHDVPRALDAIAHKLAAVAR